MLLSGILSVAVVDTFKDPWSSQSSASNVVLCWHEIN
jgi:hypothetical protein